MTAVAEGNFCEYAVEAICDQVISGLYGPSILFEGFRAVCTNTSHTETCLKIYHQHDVDVPNHLIDNLLTRMYSSHHKNSSWCSELLRAVASNGKTGVLFRHPLWKRHVISKLCISWLLKSSPACDVVLPACHLLSRNQVMGISATVETVEQDSACSSIRSYQDWLCGKSKGIMISTDAWCQELCKVGRMALEALPAELQEKILEQIFSKHLLRLAPF